MTASSITPAPSFGGRASAGSLNKRLKRWPGWAVLGIVVVVALVFGATRSRGPLTEDDRTNNIAQQLACPTCAGESVYESQAPAAINIRQQIKKMIETTAFSDNQIISVIETNYDAKTQLVPKGTGFDAVVWALPVVVLVCSIAGLTLAFRRWKRATDTVPTDDDRALVDAALRAHDDDDDI